jgi:hypothetical protein
MSRGRFVRRLSLLLPISLTGPLLTQCAMHDQASVGEQKATDSDRVYPLSEINFEKAERENQGLKMVPENATTVRDYYRGGVQEKSLAEKKYQEGNLKEAKDHFEKSDRYLEPILRLLPNDEAYRNIYGDQHITFIPNLLISDNQLKIARILEKMNGRPEEIHRVILRGKQFLSLSVRSMKSEWANQLDQEFAKILVADSK